ncbi:oxygenase MpaB family protein [Nocardia amamiensis]|uniref:oxygenase MpaB family protein n=1 Tax=Nocardia amamiensis TaxID=404578 RepID=UPI00340FB285
MTAGRHGYKWIRAEIARLDPDVDAERIVRLTTTQLLPRSLMVVHLLYTIGFVRFAGPPEAAAPVDRDGAGMLYEHGIRRADETMFHLFSWIDDGVTSRASGESMTYVRNWHSSVARAWPMPTHTFLHSAVVFALFYDRLLRRVAGAPGLTETERRAQYSHWHRVSEGMGIAEVPRTWQEAETYLENYEHGPDFAYSPEGQRLANALIDQFATRWFPRPLQWLGRWLALALCEDHVVSTLRLAAPPEAFTTAVRGIARIGAFARRHLLPDPREVLRLGDIISNHKDSALRQPVHTPLR